ncbi:MAG: hybrid sensor histidine kinase/response regulator [Planctomycetes bacterium]|nr:hybrid sensor histidine kinase/response regulator [Planctomycetota bacterium]
MPAPVPAPPPADPYRVLAVDDDPSIHILVRKNLERRGYRVETAEDGEEALRLMRSFRPDLVIADIMMPRMDGYELCRRVKADPELKEVFFIMLTAKGEVKDRVAGLDMGADHYITKPFDIHDLLARVNAGLRIVSLQRELRQKNEELARLYGAAARDNEELKRLGRIKDAFLGMAAHDLRTPLTSIKGACELILDGYMGEVAEEQRDLVRMVYEQEEAMLALINDLLDLSKIGAGKVDLHTRDTDLRELIRHHHDVNAFAARRKDIALSWDVDEGVPPVRLDPARMGQVLSNLVGNAIKFSRPGDSVRVSASRAGDREVCIAVEDTGQGIREDELGRIFDHFGQTSTRATGGEHSTGLGLAICKRLVELHGGRIRVESTWQKGSRFSVVLPLEGPSPAEAEAPSPR